MAFDPPSSSPPVAADIAPPIIDNELPAYRALEPLAILGALFGLASILTFLSWHFCAFGVLALILGLISQRKIHRLSDIYTGEKVATAGIGMGLLFSLSALTIAGVQGWMIEREAAAYARDFVKILRGGSVEDAFFFETLPRSRQGRTPSAIFDEAKAQSKGGMIEDQIRPLREMKSRLSERDQSVEFHGIQGHQVLNLDIYANALFVIKGPKTPAFPQETQYAEALLHGQPKAGGKYDWWIERLSFPVAAEKLGL